jgi:hypothetical protein
MVGMPKARWASLGSLTRFLQFGFTDLPRSLSGSTSTWFGSPWMHLAAFQVSSPCTFLTPYVKSAGLGTCP